MTTEALANTPFLILGNKCDLATAVSEPVMRMNLGLPETTGKDLRSLPKESVVRPIELFMCSILKKTGYGDGIAWLSHFL